MQGGPLEMKNSRACSSQSAPISFFPFHEYIIFKFAIENKCFLNGFSYIV